MPDSVIIREAQPEDCASVLQLMQQLAEFEGYLSQFSVTEGDILRLSFEQQKFQVLVAEQANKLQGILVYYTLPFTYDLTPWLFIKELFVSESARGRGIGEGLMQRLIQIARQQGSSKIKWEVLSNNLTAQTFYLHMGAKMEQDWQTFSLAL